MRPAVRLACVLVGLSSGGCGRTDVAGSPDLDDVMGSTSMDGSDGDGSDGDGSDDADGSAGHGGGGDGPACGDGFVDAGEFCDDGNTAFGDGCPGDCLAPAPRMGPIATGGASTCAVLGTGALKCWGAGSFGRLGYGSTTDVGDDEEPIDVGVVDVGGPTIGISIGAEHTCAVRDHGGLFCWGRGSFGRLGYSTTEDIGDADVPQQLGPIAIGDAVTAVAAGGMHTCALLESGGIRCWGYAADGRLGMPSNEDIGDDEHPFDVDDVALGGRAIQITAGLHHSCALLHDGTLRCWGRGAWGRLGYGDTENVGDDERPQTKGSVPVGETVRQVSAGHAHTCALLSTGAVRCWGRPDHGRLGYRTLEPIGDDETPADIGDVPLDASVNQITAGRDHTCALLAGGGVRCWGAGTGGRLGYGDIDDRDAATAADIDLGGDAIAITASGDHTCALLDDDTVVCWGSGENGRLGYGNTEPIGDDEPPAMVGPVAL